MSRCPVSSIRSVAVLLALLPLAARADIEIVIPEMTEAVQNIREFAKQFVSVKDSVKNLDGQIASSIPK